MVPFRMLGMVSYGTHVCHTTKTAKNKKKVVLYSAIHRHYVNSLIYATAQSEPLPVDLYKVTTCTGRGHSVAGSRTAC